ncbi:hypothetical protein ACELLULO517_05455 [Acidisoma cellulosilytica]|uniref:TonB C-terminal domain-containing protein n=1 Tax=Acidisoma cellulosilyticum TaxID=2802395 RepID=A0A963YZ11_9PROT|nr:energy transducer TonB [Acidisoma cellulosilyticum]MCB8879670.1 hypothetical protein [Acidisoma cellulosilyticum]
MSPPSPHRYRLSLAFALMTGLALTACTRNTIVLVAPTAMQVVPPGACVRPTEGPTLYPGSPAIGLKNIVGGAYPPEAMAAGIRIGCAGIIFRINPEGQAVNARLISEFPDGYGFGAKGLSDLAGEKFPPGVTDPNWHFTRLILRWTGPAPSSAPSAAPPLGSVKPWGLMG